MFKDVKNKYPKVDFHLVSDGDTLWTSDYRETMDELEQRLGEMVKYLQNRKEKNIAIVGHSSYFGQFKDNHIGYIENGDEELKHCYPYEYIIKLCENNSILDNYDIRNNKGYGTKSHMEALKEFGPTKFHRKSFKPCIMK